MSPLKRYLFTIAATCLLTTPLTAHDDDPKGEVEHIRVDAPAYRRDVDGNWQRGDDFPARRILLMTWLPLREFGNQIWCGNSCTGYVSDSGREYTLMGLSHGTGIVDVTEPGNAQIVTFVDGPESLWRDMKVYQHYAYIVSEGGHGIQVVDLANIDDGEAALLREVTTGGAVSTHTVALNAESAYLYRCGGSGNGLRIYSLEDPENPKYVTKWGDRYVHECQVVTYHGGDYDGREIAFCCTGYNGGWDDAGLDILDVTDKSNIQKIHRVPWDNPGYSHQVWLSPDRQYAYLNDELDEYYYGTKTLTIVIDVSSLEEAYVVDRFGNGGTAIDHNLYTLDKRIIESNYRSGLRIFEYTDDPVHPQEIAFFDTWPDDDAVSFNGLWNNYPYLPSRTIIGSDIERGLFVWRVIERGDVNCDGQVDFNDIDAFVTALTGEDNFNEQYPDCFYEVADANCDGSVAFDDIDPFVACLVHGGCGECAP
jgi:choice-of-anchor B domain-containing protein